MTIIDRVVALMRADVNAVLDRVEDPEEMLKQALADMRDAIAEDEARVRTLEARERALIARREHALAGIRDIDAQLDLAFESERPDLARSLVRRKLETRRLVEAIAEQTAETGRLLADRRADLEDRRAEAARLASHAGVVAAAANRTAANDGFAVTEDDIELALIAERRARMPQ